MNLVQIVCQGAMQAAALIAESKGLKPNIDKLTETLRTEVRDSFQEVAAELQNAYDAHMPESMLREIINVNCNLMAVRALRAAGCEF